MLYRSLLLWGTAEEKYWLKIFRIDQISRGQGSASGCHRFLHCQTLKVMQCSGQYNITAL